MRTNFITNLKIIDGSRGCLILQINETHQLTLHGEMLSVKNRTPLFEVYKSMSKEWDIPKGTKIKDYEFEAVISKLAEVTLQREFPFGIKVV